MIRVSYDGEYARWEEHPGAYAERWVSEELWAEYQAALKAVEAIESRIDKESKPIPRGE